MVTVGLVLGAGGVVGGAFHSGVLAALADAGWDARDASLVVGTSAGSVTGAMLRAGVAPADMLAGATGRPLSAHAEELYARTGGMPAMPQLRPTIGRLPAAPLAGLRGLVNGLAPRPIAAITGWLPDGTADGSFIAERIDAVHPDGWPADPYWACTVRNRDRALVVFGRDVLDASPGTAAQASSAIPGFFAPVRHGGESYVDGGVHSPTNVDLVAGLGFDVVVVSSPMSAVAAMLRRPAHAFRSVHARRLAAEIAIVRAAGVEVLVLQPDAPVLAAMGHAAMDVGRRAPVAQAAFDSARRHLADHPVVRRLR